MSYTITLNDAIKQYTFDQDKIVSPEKTVAGFREKCARLNLDILSQTRRIDNGRLDIPVFFSECGADARAVTGTNKQMGKGGTPRAVRSQCGHGTGRTLQLFFFCRPMQTIFLMPRLKMSAAMPWPMSRL